MTRWLLGTVAATAATVLNFGCKGADDEYAPAVRPQVADFKGGIDPRYAGTWKTDNGDSTLIIDKNGDVGIENISKFMSSKSVVHEKGTWLVDGGSLLMRYSHAAGSPVVLKYAATLSGNTLTLLQAAGRLKTVYHRK
jgi:hypothetical protein